MTPTALRRNLFQALRRVIRGETVVIETREGEILMIARKPARLSILKPPAGAKAKKIPGRILASLEQADSAMRAHLRLPMHAERSR